VCAPATGIRRFTFITLFPEIIAIYFAASVMGRAQRKRLIDVHTIDLRAHGIGRARQCDDMPYGGGAGMVLRPEPLASAIDSIHSSPKTIIYPSASGRLFNHTDIDLLRQYAHLVFLCGRYEGIDQRIIDYYVDHEVSIGNYVLSSGELAAMVISDAVARTIPGVLNPGSLEQESYQDGRVEYPHYTRPPQWRDMSVPEVLRSGDHAKISAWRRAESIKKTTHNRPDMV